MERLHRRWKISCHLADLLVRLDIRLEQAWRVLPAAARTLHLPGASLFEWPGIYIISGHRDAGSNAAVGGAEASKHLRCPALAADLRVGRVAACITSPAVWEWVGAHAMLVGLTPGFKIPVDRHVCPGWKFDYNHFEVPG